MGAISASTSIPILKEFISDSNRDVRETCEIALAKIEWDHSEEGRAHRQREQAEAEEGTQCVYSPRAPYLRHKPHVVRDRTYTSIDPAPPTSDTISLGNKPAPTPNTETIQDLRSKLLDKKLPLFQRYRAMFGLRNIGTEEAVDALAAGFADDSALFKYGYSAHPSRKNELTDIHPCMIDTRSPSSLAKWSIHTPSLHFFASSRTRTNKTWSDTKRQKPSAGSQPLRCCPTSRSGRSAATRREW